MKLIIREKYLNLLKSVKNTQEIKVITGARRVGKSKLLLSFIEVIKKEEPTANIIFVNLLDLENEFLLEYHKLHDYLLSRYIPSVNNYVFIDEVQLCPKFELAINSLHTKEMFDLYITGSNAFLLSSDLATLFTGRTFSVEIFPFSFFEFCDYYQPSNLDLAFDNYLKIGGFSGSYDYNWLFCTLNG